MREIRYEQARQLVDVEQVYEGLREALGTRDGHFRGAMHWRERDGRSYLYRRIGRVEKSLGPRSPKTEAIEAAFHRGAAAAEERITALRGRLADMAPVNRALGLGRVPNDVARIVRAFDDAGLLGRSLTIVGTNALFAYERMGGVHFESGITTTEDADLLYDVRRRLRLVAEDVRTTGILGLLRKVDHSFEPVRAGGFSARNRRGFLVDLVKPLPSDPMRSERASLADGDLVATEIVGLEWLVSAPKVAATVVDEHGQPLRVVVPDVRAFASHKLWLADRPDRDPLKRRRDRAQADALLEMLGRYRTDLALDDPAVAALPLELRRKAASRMAELSGRTGG